MSPAKKRSKGSVAARIILSVVFLLAAAWLWLNQQYVVDQLSVWRYQPTAAVTQLGERSGMSDKGFFLYYASHPELDGTQRFNQACDRKEEGTAVLGCYNGSRIFVYDVQDARLDGIKEVTAAHEMLHAAYQRLSDSERKKVNDLLEVEYKKLENDADYKERMAFYARTEPGERGNELHSVIGTEIRTVSPELEAHFKIYFKDRSKVVALHEVYQAVFRKLESEAKTLYTELQELNKAIEQKSTSYNTNVVTLNRDIQAFNARATNGDFATQSEFSSERAKLIARANSLKNQRTAINADITVYEQKRLSYNTIADESKQLVDSLNSSLAPAPAL